MRTHPWWVLAAAVLVACGGRRSTGGGAGGGGGGGAGGAEEEAPPEDDDTSSSASGEPLTGACGMTEGSFPAACVGCLEVTCCVPLQLCADNAECVALLTCVDTCEGEASCQQACGIAHPTGRVDYLEVSGCALELCAEDCAN